MAASISVPQLKSRLAAPDAPLLLDVRRAQFHAASPAMIAGASWRDPGRVDEWAGALPRDREVVVYCVHGLHVGRGVADRLAAAGRDARFLEGGIAAWRETGGSTTAKPVKGVRWITRERPKIDRVACPWLIRRFIDPAAEFVFVPSDRVLAEAERLAAIPYDVPDVDLSHRGEKCSFDAFLDEYGLDDPALARLAVIVRGADTGRPELAPQAAGLLAISLGLSANFPDDHEMLRHGFVVYDALHAWCRSLQGETHGWPPKP
jgi:rhodanese-related sulfurtransferase